MISVEDALAWPAWVDSVLKDILSKARDYQQSYEIVGRAHYLAADRYASFNRALGIPVVVITAIVGTTIFGTLDKNPTPSWKIAAGLVSLTGTVLSALQTSLGFAQTAAKHKAAGESYRAVRRRFEMFELKYAPAAVDQRSTAMSELQELVAQLDDLPKEFPIIPDGCYNRAHNEFIAKQASVGGPAPRESASSPSGGPPA